VLYAGLLDRGGAVDAKCSKSSVKRVADTGLPAIDSGHLVESEVIGTNPIGGTKRNPHAGLAA